MTTGNDETAYTLNHKREVNESVTKTKHIISYYLMIEKYYKLNKTVKPYFFNNTDN